MPLYLPSRDEVLAVAERAKLSNTHPDAGPSLIKKLHKPPSDWEERIQHDVPGLVWTVASDTCMTGRPNAPDNIGYDEYGAEFVFRQPRNEAELVGIMRADSEEVFACYRFDGVDRWTANLVDCWHNNTVHVITGWLRDLHLRERGTALGESAHAYLTFLRSEEFKEYLLGLEAFLAGPKRSTLRRGKGSG